MKEKQAVSIDDLDLPPDFEGKVQRSFNLGAEIKALESEREEIKDYLRAHLEANEVDKLDVHGKIMVTMSVTQRATIVADKLIELGVRPNIIAQATKITPSTSITFREIKG